MFATLWDGLALHVLGTQTTEVTVHTILSSVIAYHWSKCLSFAVSVLQATVIDGIPGLVAREMKLAQWLLGTSQFLTSFQVV